MTQNQSSNGVNFVSLLTLLFIALKLLDKINWSWWWVLSPMLILALFWIGVLLIVGLVVLLRALFK